MLTHKQIWNAIDAIAARHNLSASGLAKLAGLDQFVAIIEEQNGGAPHRPLRLIPLIGLAQAGDAGYFDDAGFPAGAGWEEIAFPELGCAHTYALEIAGDSMLPVYRDGDRIIVSPSASTRRGDRVVVKTTHGEVMVKQLGRKTMRRIELCSLNADFENRSFDLPEILFMHRIIWASQ